MTTTNEQLTDRELDAWIAEHIMKWRFSIGVDNLHYWLTPDYQLRPCHRWCPSSDMAAAWQVAEQTRLLKKYLLSQEWGADQHRYEVLELWPDDYDGAVRIIVKAPTMPQAICRAIYQLHNNGTIFPLSD